MGCRGAAWRYEYDERGNLQAVSDPLHQRTVYGYDRHGRGADNRRGAEINTCSGTKMAACATRTALAFADGMVL
ncbi:RHS repeat protein [Salmonella enterica subsp. enterica]|nr:RHS repeat protein [Salmonella enterica subsp. enterica]